MITVQFTPDLLSLQGVLISADYVHSFNSLTTKGGNEKKIDFVIDSVRNFLKNEKYLNDKGIAQDAVDTMRRFAFYIVLNSDLPVLNELVSTDSSIDLLIWTVPTIAKCLMCEMLWKLYMENFVYEIISFSYPQLSLELTDALLFNMKYFNPNECLTQLKALSTACFTTLCRINFFDYDENQLKLGFSNFQKCMMYFCNPPNENKLEQLKKDDLYKYYGNCLHTMLTILWDCFNNYTTTQLYNLHEPVAIYEITYKNENAKKAEYKPCQLTDKSLSEILNKCLADLLDKCMTLVMGINLDIFCAWSEFEEGGVSMQETIGQLSYKVREYLLNSEVSEHPVVSMLEQISRKPTDVQEIICTTDSSVIIENIEKQNNESTQWLQALINTDKMFEDVTLLPVLESNLDKLSEDCCYRLFMKLYDYILTKSENIDTMKLFAIKVYQQCNSVVKQEFLESHFKDGCFNNLMESTQFLCMLTEIFNKLTSQVTPDSDLIDILNVFVQNPQQVYVRIFNSAIENQQQMNLMYKVITYLKNYSNHYYNEDTEPCLMITLKNAIDGELDTDNKQDNLISFIKKLKDSGIVPGTKLLMLVIMPKLHTALINKNFKVIHLHCSMLHKSYTIDELVEYRAPMLAMLAQVMTQVRWKIDTFDVIAPTTLSLVIDLQTSLINTYKRAIPDNEVSWLKSKVKELDPLNMYYYKELWNPPGNTFVEVISGIHIHLKMDIEVLTLWLAQVLCSSTTQEWDSIWNSLKVFGDSKIMDFFYNAMIYVIEAEKSHRSQTTWTCLLYCLKNLVHCMRYKFLKEPLSNSQVSTVTNILVNITNLLQEDGVEEFGAIAIPLFGYIVQRKKDYTIDISESLKSNLSDNKLSAMINNLFSNGSS